MRTPRPDAPGSTDGAAPAGRDAGMTLVELLIVIVVLGILSGIVLFGVGRFRGDAQAAACNADQAAVRAAAAAYDAATGSYPGDTDTLVAGGYLKQRPEGTYQFDATSKTANRVPACTGTAAPPPRNRYGFDELSGPTASDSGAGANGTYDSGVTFGGPPAPGTSGQSIGCDGSTSVIRYPLGDLFSGRSPFTVALWLRPSIVDDGYRVLFKKGQLEGSFPDRIGFGINQQGEYGIVVERFDGTGARDVIVTNQALTVGRWYHLAVTYDGAVLTLYLDRTLAASTPATLSVPSTAAYPAESCHYGPNYSAGTFAGQLDELRIWAEALDADQITGLP